MIHQLFSVLGVEEGEVLECVAGEEEVVGEHLHLGVVSGLESVPPLDLELDGFEYSFACFNLPLGLLNVVVDEVSVVTVVVDH